MITKDKIEGLGIKVKYEGRNNFICFCPFPGHKDTNPSLSISKDDGKFQCFGCGRKGRSFISLKIQLKGTSYEDIETIKERILSTVSEKVSLLKIKGFKRVSINTIPLPDSFKAFTTDNNEGKYWDYLIKRLKKDTIISFGIGYCDNGTYKGRIIIPVKIKGKNYGFLARSIDSSFPKYLYPVNFQPCYLLFNIDSLDGFNEAIICESVLDCLTLNGLNIKNSIATFGALISPWQIFLLLEKKIRKVILCFHSDFAGRNAIFKNLYLKDIFEIVERIELPSGKDVNDLGEGFLSYFKNRKKL